MEYKTDGTKYTVEIDTWPLSKAITELLGAQRAMITLDTEQATVDVLTQLARFKTALVAVGAVSGTLWNEVTVVEHFLIEQSNKIHKTEGP